jgi:hypothetical protein
MSRRQGSLRDCSGLNGTGPCRQPLEPGTQERRCSLIDIALPGTDGATQDFRNVAIIDGATDSDLMYLTPPMKGCASQSAASALAVDRGWKRRDEPIRLPRGRQLVTLEDAGNYITRLPKAEHEAAEWQAAMEALILVATRDQ